MPQPEIHETTAHRFALDLASLRRQHKDRGEMRWTFGGSEHAHAHWTLRPKHLELVFWIGGNPRTQIIRFAKTETRFGGERTWFCCPGCFGRCRVLYYGGADHRCRKCLGLSYPSQRENPRWRGVAAAQRLRMRLGGSGNLVEPFPAKPRGMHWAKYDRLVERELTLLLSSFAALDKAYLSLGD